MLFHFEKKNVKARHNSYLIEGKVSDVSIVVALRLDKLECWFMIKLIANGI